jgi:putative serine protease PepD
MTGLAIPAHSRRLSRLAVVTLTLLAAGSFTLGVARQFGAAEPTPFSTPQGAAAGHAFDAIPYATPAPALQVATSEPVRRPVARSLPDVTDALPEPPALVPAEPVAAADAPPAADASATAPEMPPPVPDTTPPPT